MAVSSEGITPVSQGQDTTSLIKRLLITWGCGLLFGCGMFLSAWFVLVLVGAAIGSFGSFDAFGLIILVLCLSPLAMAPGPILLGWRLAHNWLRGITRGLLGLVAGIAGLLVYYWAAGFFENIFSFNTGVFVALLAAFPAVLIVTTIILMNYALSFRRYFGLWLGLVIGIGLAIASGVTFEGVFPGTYFT